MLNGSAPGSTFSVSAKFLPALAWSPKSIAVFFDGKSERFFKLSRNINIIRVVTELVDIAGEKQLVSRQLVFDIRFTVLRYSNELCNRSSKLFFVGNIFFWLGDESMVELIIGFEENCTEAFG